MFTGIIIALGRIIKIETLDGDRRLTIAASDIDFSQVNMGDSIAVNGVCLTVIAKTDNSFSVDVSVETLTRTSLTDMTVNSLVNLELALTPSTPLGGHIVSGHVDGLGEVVSKEAVARSWQYDIVVPDSIKRFIAEKGSVCIDGVSLTVNTVDDNRFSITIIPHTYEHTVFHQYQVGDKVNIEVDMLARYVARLMD